LREVGLAGRLQGVGAALPVAEFAVVLDGEIGGVPKGDEHGISLAAEIVTSP